jgi:hypothetical protein
MFVSNQSAEGVEVIENGMTTDCQPNAANPHAKTAPGAKVVEEAKSCAVPVLPEEVDARCSHMRRGWSWSTQAFGERMRKLAAGLMKKRGGAPRSRAY